MWGRVKPLRVWLVYTVKSWEERQSSQDIEEKGGTVILLLRCEVLPSGGGLFSNQQLRMFPKKKKAQRGQAVCLR